MLTFTDTELRHLGVALEFYLGSALGDRPHAATALAKVLEELDRRGIGVHHMEEETP